jgi:hypothetical protein
MKCEKNLKMIPKILIVQKITIIFPRLANYFSNFRVRRKVERSYLLPQSSYGNEEEKEDEEEGDKEEKAIIAGYSSKATPRSARSVAFLYGVGKCFSSRLVSEISPVRRSSLCEICK